MGMEMSALSQCIAPALGVPHGYGCERKGSLELTNMLLMAHFFLTIPAYNSISPGIDCRATSEPAVSCQALSPLTSHEGSVLPSELAMMTSEMQG